MFFAWALLVGPLVSLCVAAAPVDYPVKLVEPLQFHDEFVEVTDAGTLRRRYRVWGDYTAEVRAWMTVAQRTAASIKTPPRRFRLGCLFLKNAEIVSPEVMGMDSKPLQAVFSTPPDFVKAMERTAVEYSVFAYAFTRGAVECEWLFETLEGLRWTAPGKAPAWGCQPRAIGEQVERALAKYKDARVDMWVWCAGSPRTLNGGPKQKVGGPPYGISYTQWQLFGGYSIVISAPHLPLVVHEVNHRYLDNLKDIEGVQLTQFHGLSLLGYAAGDLGYPDLLSTYRSVYLHLIRPAMWRRFSLTGPPTAKPEPFSGKRYRWADVADDCWFRLPLLQEAELAKLTGLPGLKCVGGRNQRWRQWAVPNASRALIRSPYRTDAGDQDTALNNGLSLGTESCAVLHTATGHWLIVRPEVADVFVEMLSLHGRGAPLEAIGWLNEGVCPLLVLLAPVEVGVPEKEVGYFR
jgi:hypothetical protein